MHYNEHTLWQSDFAVNLLNCDTVNFGWICFQRCAKNNYNYEPLALIVSYVLTIPGDFIYYSEIDSKFINGTEICFSQFEGANDPPERCFSIAKRMWSSDRSELTLTRIRSMMLVKFNTNQTCIKFFNAIKNQPEILQGGKKYEENSTRMNNRSARRLLLTHFFSYLFRRDSNIMLFILYTFCPTISCNSIFYQFSYVFIFF